MPGEAQDASIGYNGEVWVRRGNTAAYQLRHVVSFSLPRREYNSVDSTHLKSPNFSEEEIPGLSSVQQIEITLNSRPLSDTDILLDDWATDRDIADVILVVPINGVPTKQYAFPAQVMSYDPGEVSNDKMESSLTITIKGTVVAGAYVAPSGN